MLEVKVDLLPLGEERRRRRLTTIHIINLGDHIRDGVFGNYRVEAWGNESDPANDPPDSITYVTDYERVYGASALVGKAIEALEDARFV